MSVVVPALFMTLLVGILTWQLQTTLRYHWPLLPRWVIIVAVILIALAFATVPLQSLPQRFSE